MKRLMTKMAMMGIILSGANAAEPIELNNQSWNYLLNNSRTIDKLIPEINSYQQKNPDFFNMNYMQADGGEGNTPWSVKIDNKDVAIAKIQNNYLAAGYKNFFIAYNEINAKSGGVAVQEGITFRETGLGGTVPIVDYFSITGAYVLKQQNIASDEGFYSEKLNSNETLIMGNFMGQKLSVKGGVAQNKKEETNSKMLLNRYQYNDNLALTADLKLFDSNGKTSTEIFNKVEYFGIGRDYTVSTKNLQTDDKTLNDGLISSIAKVKFHDRGSIKGDKYSYFELALSNSKEFSQKEVVGYRVKFSVNTRFGEYDLSFSKNFVEDLEILPVVDSSIFKTGVKFRF